MIALILGFGSAVLFVALSIWVYGLHALAEGWVALVFWGLIGSALVVFAIARPKPAWLCRLYERAQITEDLCDTPEPCRH